MYVPTFQFNLISVYQLVAQFDGIAQFSKVVCVLQGPSLKKPLVLGKLDKGLYKLDITQSTSMPCSSLSVVSFPVIEVCSPDSVFPVDPVCNSTNSTINKMDVLWHFRLGHVPFSKMKLISDISSCLSPKQSFPCSVCPLARQTRLPFPDSSIQSSSPFQLIHVDTWGPYHSPTSGGARYFLTIVDDYTRATWTHLLGSKSSAFDLLKAFIAMVDTHFSFKIQSVRSDNALELGSSTYGSKFFTEKGIIHQTSCLHTPQ